MKHGQASRGLRNSFLATGGLAAGLVGALAGPAFAGGRGIGGSGAESTSRAGASVASSSGADALGNNPAGLATGHGVRIALSSSFIDYSLSFTRTGTYDTYADDPDPWAGDPYPTVHDESKPAIGFGGFQATPSFAAVFDLSKQVPGLHVAVGLASPNAYPGRSFGEDYNFDSIGPPPPGRYDVASQEAALAGPSLGVAYKISDKLDVGARFIWNIANFKAKVWLWGIQNYEEWTGSDAIFSLEGADHFAPSGQLGVRYRPTSNIEVGFQYSSPVSLHVEGTGSAITSPRLTLGGLEVTVQPVEDNIALCKPGGTAAAMSACVDLELPMNATLGGRYILRDAQGGERGDLEANVHWENWSADRATNYLIIVDGIVAIDGTPSLPLKESILAHGLRDTFSARLGGSYRFPVGNATLIARGGLAYDTAAAKKGWERLDEDGAQRITSTGGVGYQTERMRFDLGLGYVFQGTRTVEGNCNPTIPVQGCSGSGSDTPFEDRQGPDPINPTIDPEFQKENPINQGTYKSNYFLFTLGVSTQF